MQQCIQHQPIILKQTAISTRTLHKDTDSQFVRNLLCIFILAALYWSLIWIFNLYLFSWSLDIILKEGDLAILLDLLKPATPHWRDAGLALGFHNYELTTIEQIPLLIPGGDTSFFKEMLCQWLRRAPPNHLWPTSEALQLALQKSGHENLAVNLIPEFIQRLRGPNYF